MGGNPAKAVVHILGAVVRAAKRALALAKILRYDSLFKSVARQNILCVLHFWTFAKAAELSSYVTRISAPFDGFAANVG